MEQELNIAAILKDKLVGTKLWSPIYGDCEFLGITSKTRPIQVTSNSGTHYFREDGRYDKDGEVCLFPSKQMQDWSKFAWKKGDIVVCRGEGSIGIFDSFTNDTYTDFRALFYYDAESKDYFKRMEDLDTLAFRKADENDSMDYVNNIENVFGGKLNLETLEIEKPEPQSKAKDWCLMRRGNIDAWHLCQYSDTCDDGYYAVGGNFFKQCIPYNDQTAHLLGTTDGYEEGGEE